MSSSTIESAKIWRATHLSPTAIRLGTKWDEAWTLNTTSGRILVVPAPEQPLGNIDYAIRRVFVFSLSGNQVSKGEIIEFMGNKYDVSDNLDKLITAYYNKSNIDKFTGSIYEYDINYMRINSTVSFIWGCFKIVPANFKLLFPCKFTNWNRHTVYINTSSPSLSILASRRLTCSVQAASLLRRLL